MTVFNVLYLILKLTDTLLNLWFKGRRFYRWIRLKRNKQKPTAKG